MWANLSTFKKTFFCDVAIKAVSKTNDSTNSSLLDYLRVSVFCLTIWIFEGSDDTEKD